MFSTDDARHMARALELARRGQLTTRPNPRVGCVLVRDGEVVGEGFHIRAGGPHAEVHALRAAGDKARGATAYVTLEPCSHYGRTPPCSQALIDAGVARVVAAMVDPNPQVAGRGLAMLEAAGIETQHGLMANEAEAVNPGFMKRMRTGRPFVRVKLAASLDGRTALANGQSKWITGPEARADVQRLRAISDAVITGADSVLADNPSMNVRHAELGHWQSRISEADLQQPLRVVVDGKARLAPPLKLLDSDGPLMLASLRGYDCHWPASVSVWSAADNGAGKVDLSALLDELGRQQINEVLVEAGSALAGAFISAGLWDELWLYQAPKLMGSEARGLLALPGVDTMAEVPSLTIQDVRRVGADLRLILTRQEKP
ncbi:bifunctional diaminohydroxyphosphoribosylaminopyrimidine deaminase/5-amino-6-(5-phosphoribosylamino)uracil reductase RibD [Ferrimonas balearica]|uniref:bifunctional diaminohydroxyphosphoribosylaminopyrimidine deaminase/5-amino-6-(5-phosphoribosylamino)uracil reductase RibD n=1 Tax=Ferrimonas balearica TaxID=44012 RepID=UPI001C964BBC|nr:bifunctional diaminohydroxyphosphoribosylaminopyrimidine deaminase/5-amino-6-(5-phosphoribosylamino)uracil reductase RibD [Ferrimonas balearica]MBY6224861.1 bifunctional diaminohydroxyphosphoribosylaminopyrimidine deaminase/5-amino-6-(5-phosphoribosylamino)uracil reductase RibD [Ferrimonas balearica]